MKLVGNLKSQYLETFLYPTINCELSDEYVLYINSELYFTQNTFQNMINLVNKIGCVDIYEHLNIEDYVEKLKWNLNLITTINPSEPSIRLANVNQNIKKTIICKSLEISNVNLKELLEITKLTLQPSKIKEIIIIKKVLGFYPEKEYLHLDLEIIDLLKYKHQEDIVIPKISWNFDNFLYNFIPKNIISLKIHKSWIKLNKNFKFMNYKNTNYLENNIYSRTIREELYKLNLLYKYGGYLISNSIQCLIPIENWNFLNDIPEKDLIFIVDEYDHNKNIIISTAKNYKLKKLIKFIVKLEEPNINYTTKLFKNLNVYFADLSI